MDECLGLISLHFSQVIVITTEVSVLENFPVYSIQIRDTSEELCRRQSGMAVGEDERDAVLNEFRKRAHQDSDFVVASLLNASISSLNIEQHDRQRCEIKWYVVAQRSPWRDWYADMVAIIDQVWIPDINEVRIEAIRFSAMETISEDPRKIVPMGDPENETLLRVEDVPQCRRRHPRKLRKPGAAVPKARP